MTASRDSADCNAAVQVCVGTAELFDASQPCAAQLTKKENWLLGTDNNAQVNNGMEMD